MDQTNSTTDQVAQGVLSAKQKDDLLKELGLDNLPDDRKDALVQTMVDSVLNRIFARISAVLTDQDMQSLSDLQLRPDADQAINTYLVGRVPNLDAIATEEIEAFRKEIKDTVSSVKASIPELNQANQG